MQCLSSNQSNKTRKGIEKDTNRKRKGQIIPICNDMIVQDAIKTSLENKHFQESSKIQNEHKEEEIRKTIQFLVDLKNIHRNKPNQGGIKQWKFEENIRRWEDLCAYTHESAKLIQ